jgi:hypothetical protein
MENKRFKQLVGVADSGTRLSLVRIDLSGIAEGRTWPRGSDACRSLRVAKRGGGRSVPINDRVA